MKKQEKNVTVFDIAKYLNLSPSTISRALNNNPKISQKTKEKVWEAAQKLGYTPNIPAYILNSTGRTILFIINEKDVYYNYFISRLIPELRKNNIDALFYYIEENISVNIDFLKNINFAALFLVSDNTIPENLNSFIKESGTPVFSLSSDDKLVQVKLMIDFYNAGYLVAKHLTNYGAQKIAILSTNKVNTGVEENIRNGINSALQFSSGVSVQRINFSHINNLFNFDAIIALTPELACKTFCKLRQDSIKVPQQVMLASIGSGECFEILPIGITSVLFSFDEIITELVNVIERSTIEENVKEEIIIPTRIIIKSSTLKL